MKREGVQVPAFHNLWGLPKHKFHMSKCTLLSTLYQDCWLQRRISLKEGFEKINSISHIFRTPLPLTSLASHNKNSMTIYAYPVSDIECIDNCLRIPILAKVRILVI